MWAPRAGAGLSSEASEVEVARAARFVTAAGLDMPIGTRNGARLEPADVDRVVAREVAAEQSRILPSRRVRLASMAARSLLAEATDGWCEQRP